MHLFANPQILIAQEDQKMKQPTSQEERNRDKKDPEQNPSRGIDPQSGARRTGRRRGTAGRAREARRSRRPSGQRTAAAHRAVVRRRARRLYDGG